MAKFSPKKWSERSERSKQRILRQYRKVGMSDRQIRSAVDRGDLRPYARKAENKLSTKMQQRRPDLIAKIAPDRERLFKDAAAKWIEELDGHISFGPGGKIRQRGGNEDRIKENVQWLYENGFDDIALFLLTADPDVLIALAEPQKKSQMEHLRVGISRSRLKQLGWTDENGWHNPFWYH